LLHLFFLNLILAARRYEAATWLRNMGATELPETPSEEEFKLFLKNGIILCNVLNKIHPGAVSQVILPCYIFILLKKNHSCPWKTSKYHVQLRKPANSSIVHQKQVNHPVFFIY
jgi:Calponin homology (CH) domain